MTDEQLKEQILELTAEWSRRKHSSFRRGTDSLKSKFIPGYTKIPYAGRTFTEDEVVAAVNATLEFWLTLGPEGESMERELAKFLGIRKSLLVNSGSSANLIALSTLTSPLINKERRLKHGDEVITCVTSFPTTVTPIIQNGCVPVFLDNDPVTGNVCSEFLEEAYSAGKTKAVFLAHTLGNPFDLATVTDFCKRHNLWLIEDNCDALGSSYSMSREVAQSLKLFGNSPNLGSTNDSLIRFTGTWGDLSTQSFYPPHHLTMGEGGAVNISGSIKLYRPAKSFRDWGRDCWCDSGKDNTCGKRFEWKKGGLTYGYDHKYIYSHLGYNLKPLDTQAAIGRIQLKQLHEFIEDRKQNWNILRTGLDELEEFFEFTLPTHATGWSPKGFQWDDSGNRSECSWFGFMLLVRENAPFKASHLARHLDQHKIGNRMLFGGNLLLQPAFQQLKEDRPGAFRIVGNMQGANKLMRQSLFLGTYPGLSNNMIEYEMEVIRKYLKSL